MRLCQLCFEEHEVPAIGTTALVLRGLEENPRRALIMQHGAGGNKFSAIGKAVAFAQAGYLVAAIVMVLLTLEDRIEAAIPYIGNPNWFRHGDLSDETRRFLTQYNPWGNLDRFHPKAVLFLNGEDDDIAKPEAARELVKVLKPYYEDAPQRIAAKGYAGVGHNLSEEMRQDALDWLTRFYPPA